MTSGSTISAGLGTRSSGAPASGASSGRSAAALFALTVVLGAAATVAACLTSLHWRQPYSVRAGVILGLAVIDVESSVLLARIRRYLAPPARVDMVVVWIAAAVLCVPPAYVSVLVPAMLGYEALRRRSKNANRPNRLLFTLGSVTLAAVAGRIAFQSVTPSWLPRYGGGHAIAVLVGVATLAIATSTLGALLGYLTLEVKTWRGLLPKRDEQALELAMLVLGVLASELISGTTFLAPIVLVLIELLRRSAMVSQLQVAATTDAKTGLLNAAAWEQLAQRELLRAQRDRVPGAVMLLDLDHFKRLNDTLGHLRGDMALKAVADALAKELRGYDAVARFGGEEFVVFLNDLSVSAASVVAERVLTRIRNLSITGADEAREPYRMTASIGLAAYPADGDSLTELLEAADRALYDAKHDGRDRVGLAGASRPPDTAQPVAESRGHDGPGADAMVTRRAREAS